jgi:hypothetical protein
VAGQRLGSPGTDKDAPAEPDAWHVVQLHRSAREFTVSVDGHPVRCQPGVAGITPRLTVEPAADRPTLVRNLRVTW